MSSLRSKAREFASERTKTMLGVFIYIPNGPVRELALALDITAKQRMERKDVLVELHLLDENGQPIEVKDGSWTLSDSLRAPFNYLPAIEGRATFEISAFKSPVEFSAAVVCLRPWGQKEVPPVLLSCRCMAIERVEGNRAAARDFRPLSKPEDMA